MIVLGCDPGLADFGWCAVELLDEPVSVGLFGKPVRERLVDWGHIKTEPGKKGSGKKSDHNLRRIRTQACALLGVTNKHGPVHAICAEAQSWPHPPVLDPDMLRMGPALAAQKLEAATFGVLGSSTMLAMSWGVLGMLSVLETCEVIQVSPQTMRARLLGQRKGDKRAIEDALVARYGEAWLGGVLSVPKSNREHITDSIAAVVACLDEPAIVKLRGNPLGLKTVPTGDVDFG